MQKLPFCKFPRNVSDGFFHTWAIVFTSDQDCVYYVDWGYANGLGRFAFFMLMLGPKWNGDWMRGFQLVFYMEIDFCGNFLTSPGKTISKEQDRWYELQN